jgi:hypothetical protein
MYWDDHNPPHIHVKTSESEVIISLIPISILQGELSKRTKSFVFEWIAEHHSELLENWENAKNKKPLFHIKPLE